MALIVCPECQREVSDKAVVCPACGYPIHGGGKSINTSQLPPNVITVRKSRGIYIILGIFFGFLGVHNFYAGYYWQGVIQLLLGAVFFFTIIGPIIVLIWILVDLIFNKYDANNHKMV